MSDLFVGKLHLSLRYDYCSGVRESPGYISLLLSEHNSHSHLAINRVYSMLRFWIRMWDQALLIDCKAAGCTGLSQSFRHLRSASLGVGDWNPAWVSLAKLQLWLPGIPWLMIEVQAQLGSEMQSRMRFMDWSDAKIDECGLNTDLIRMCHSSPGTAL
jgi:hypothetical protein